MGKSRLKMNFSNPNSTALIQVTLTTRDMENFNK